MYKRSQPLMNKDVNDYERSKNKKSQHDQNRKDLEYFLNNPKSINILKKRNIKELYPIQAQTFKPIYSGQDVIARDRTGSGKTLAFTLPVLQRLREEKKFQHRSPKFLIILPTRELVIQVHNQIQSLKYKDQDDFEAYCVYGKTSIEENVKRLSKGVDILVGTPGRLNDLITRGNVKLESIEVLCLDEADQILKQGFKQEIEKVFSEIHKVNKNKIQILLFSATIPQWLKDLSEQYQGKDAPYINMIKDDQIRTSKTIKHYAMEISRMGQFEVVGLIQQMVEKYGGHEKRILIFCEKKTQVDNLSKNLKIKNQPLHGDVAQRRREFAYRDFKAGILRCIVATNVAARGLDFPSVDLVIQMCPPLNTQEYIHRAGRTGRAGKQGICLTFFDRTRSRIISKIENEANISIQQLKPDNFRNYQPRNDYDNDRNNDKYGRNFNRDRDNRDERNSRGNYGSRDSNGGNDRYQESKDRYQSRRDNNFSRQNNDRQKSYNKGGYESNNFKVDPRMKYSSRNEKTQSPNERNKQDVKTSPCHSRSNSRSISKSPQRKRDQSPKNSRVAQKDERRSCPKPSYDDDY